MKSVIFSPFFWHISWYFWLGWSILHHWHSCFAQSPTAILNESIWLVLEASSLENWCYHCLLLLSVRYFSHQIFNPTPFGSVSCLVVGVCLSNCNLNSFLIHQASYSKGYQWYLMHRDVLESIWKIGRCPTKVSEFLCNCINARHYFTM